jgi:hypothetical protein
MTLSALLGGIGACLDEGLDRVRWHLPPTSDLERAQLPGGDQAPGSRVIDAKQLGHLAKVEEEWLNGSHVLALWLACNGGGLICCFAAGVRSRSHGS